MKPRLIERMFDAFYLFVESDEGLFRALSDPELTLDLKARIARELQRRGKITEEVAKAIIEKGRKS